MKESPHAAEEIFDGQNAVKDKSSIKSGPDNINVDIERQAVIESFVENANLLEFQFEEHLFMENVVNSNDKYRASQKPLVKEDFINQIDATPDELQCEPENRLFKDFQSEDDNVVAGESPGSKPFSKRNNSQREKSVENEEVSAKEGSSSSKADLRELFADSDDLVLKAGLKPLDHSDEQESAQKFNGKDLINNATDQALQAAPSNSDQTESNSSGFMDRIFMHSRSVSFSDSESELEVEICIDEKGQIFFMTFLINTYFDF